MASPPAHWGIVMLRAGAMLEVPVAFSITAAVRSAGEGASLAKAAGAATWVGAAAL